MKIYPALGSILGCRSKKWTKFAIDGGHIPKDTWWVSNSNKSSAHASVRHIGDSNRATQILKQNWILWTCSFTGCMMETETPDSFWLAIKSVLTLIQCFRVGRDKAVCITTRHELEDPGIKFGWGQYFPHPFRQTLGLTQPLVSWVLILFSRRKAAGAWRSQLTHLESKSTKE